MSSVPFTENSVNRYGTTTQQQRKQFEQHDRLAKWLKIGRVVIITIITIAATIYFFGQYLTKTTNVAVHTDVESNTQFIESPYFYFSCLNASELDITKIQMLNFGVEETTFNFSVYNASNFKFKPMRSKWSVVYLNDSFIFQLGIAKQLLVIPPTNGKHIIYIHKGASLKINTFVQKYTSDPLRDFWSGIFWAVDSVNDGIIQEDTNNIEHAFSKRFGSTFFQHQYSTFAANTESALEVIIEKDMWDKKHTIDTYYKANVNADVYHESHTDTLNHNNSFYFFINPTGAGVQTIITTEKEYSFWVVLSSIGGICSPILAITLTILNIIIFGFNCGERECCGYAKTTQLSKIEKARIKQYLKELQAAGNPIQE